MGDLVCKKSFVVDTFDFKLRDGFCFANCGLGKDWLTVYLIATASEHQGKGEATKLLTALKEFCNKTGRTLRIWAPNERCSRLCEKLKIESV